MSRTSLWAPSWVGARLVKGIEEPLAEVAPHKLLHLLRGPAPQASPPSRPGLPTQSCTLPSSAFRRYLCLCPHHLGLKELTNDSLTIMFLP